MLIRLAGFRGWTLRRHPTFAGAKTAYWLTRESEHTRIRIGTCLAEVATELFLEAMDHGPHPQEGDPSHVGTPRGRARA